MPDVTTAEGTLAQIREVAAWWGADARAEEARADGDDWHAQAARSSRRQADDWHALGDLLYAIVYPHSQLGLPHLARAAERLADRLDPDWRNVRTEVSSDAK